MIRLPGPRHERALKPAARGRSACELGGWVLTSDRPATMCVKRDAPLAKSDVAAERRSVPGSGAARLRVARPLALGGPGGPTPREWPTVVRTTQNDRRTDGARQLAARARRTLRTSTPDDPTDARVSGLRGRRRLGRLLALRVSAVGLGARGSGLRTAPRAVRLPN